MIALLRSVVGGVLGVNVVAAVTWLLAGATGDGSDPVLDPGNPLTWVNLGVLGVLFFMFSTDRLFSRRTVERLIVERDKADATKDDALRSLSERVIPLAEQYHQTLVPTLRSVQETLVVVKDLLPRDDHRR